MKFTPLYAAVLTLAAASLLCFIPATGADPSPQPRPANLAAAQACRTCRKLVDLNSAPADQLKALPLLATPYERQISLRRPIPTRPKLETKNIDFRAGHLIPRSPRWSCQPAGQTVKYLDLGERFERFCRWRNPARIRKSPRIRVLFF